MGSIESRREKEEAREDATSKESNVEEPGFVAESKKGYSKSDVVVETAQMVIDVVRLGQRVSRFFRPYLKKRPLT